MKRQPSDEDLKAAFIAKRGVTQCPTAYLIAVGKIDPRITGPIVSEPDRPIQHVSLNPWKKRSNGYGRKGGGKNGE